MNIDNSKYGLLVDKKAWRGLVMITGSLLLGLTGIDSSVPFIVMGISFSLVPSDLWPAVPILTGEQYLGTAYGLIGWIQNIGLALFPWIGGKLADAAGGMTIHTCQIMFAYLGFVGLIFSLLLKTVDKRRGLGLKLPGSKAHG